jgi:hypothetical protein
MNGTSHGAVRLFIARYRLVDEWERRVRADEAIPSARALDPARLRDHVPRFIDSSVEALRDGERESDARERVADIARVHAADRIDAGFELGEVERELLHLHDVIAEELTDVMSRSLIAEAVAEARTAAERAFASSGVKMRANAGLPASAADATGESRRS